MLQAIAIHHARPEHADEFAAFMKRVMAATAEAHGLIEFTSWREAGGTRLIGLSRWESQEAFSGAMPLIMSLSHERREEWSERPDELIVSTSVD